MAYTIYGKRQGDVLRVTFIWGIGFPLKHAAYIYVSDGKWSEKDPDLRRAWPISHRINEHWFRVID